MNRLSDSFSYARAETMFFIFRKLKALVWFFDRGENTESNCRQWILHYYVPGRDVMCCVELSQRETTSLVNLILLYFRIMNLSAAGHGPCGRKFNISTGKYELEKYFFINGPS
jgi:hypothetical protein